MTSFPTFIVTCQICDFTVILSFMEHTNSSGWPKENYPPASSCIGTSFIKKTTKKILRFPEEVMFHSFQFEIEDD